MSGADLSLRWQERSSCRGQYRLFYSDNVDDQDRAKAICRRCEVWRKCLAYALLNGETHGVWGGTTYGERRGMRVMSSALNIDLDTRQRDILQGVDKPPEIVRPLFNFQLGTVSMFNFDIASAS